MKVPNLREMSAPSGKNVHSTSQLKGTAKDSLSGTNVTKQYTTSGDACPGPYGGMNKGK